MISSANINSKLKLSRRDEKCYNGQVDFFCPGTFFLKLYSLRIYHKYSSLYIRIKDPWLYLHIRVNRSRGAPGEPARVPIVQRVDKYAERQ